MVQSVELLLDVVADSLVRDQWAALSAAGLPSQADHAGASNAPHVTVGVADAIDDAAEARLTSAAGSFPMRLQLGPLVLLGGGRVVLARMVVMTPELLALHAAVCEALSDCPGPSDYLQPGQWVPHVTLARRLKPDMLPHALEVLAARADPATPVQVEAVALRRWDSTARRTWIVGT